MSAQSAGPGRDEIRERFAVRRRRSSDASLLKLLAHIVFLVAGFVSLQAPTKAQASSRALSSQVRAIISLPDRQLDYTTSKLALDRLIDPTFDEAAIRRELDDLAALARTIAERNSTDEMKLRAVRRIIYQAGAWNGQNPFAYDLADPLGLNVHNKLLSTYLRTRRGNCVSMPTLFLILADRLGLSVSFATAPLHVFIRYTDPQGRAFNIETTSWANLVQPDFLRRSFPMTDRALESGLYMRTLTRREAVALMAVTVMEWALVNGRHQDAIEIADAILEQSPRDGFTMVKRGHAYGELLRLECTERFPTRATMPAPIQARCDYLQASNMRDFGQAEALGWQPAA